jgi:two-component sensor histidine kinase
VLRGVLAQEIHHRVKNNLQTVASLLRLQARTDGVDARKALNDSVNRILAIAAVHEVLTERRDEDVELDELLDRLRAMLVQGLGTAKTVEASLEPVSLGGNQATALALVFSELLQNALEHGGEPASGTGLSIVRALVQDELGGRLALESNGGLRAEVVFPAP